LIIFKNRELVPERKLPFHAEGLRGGKDIASALILSLEGEELRTFHSSTNSIFIKNDL
jgi:hypothetical protein